MSEIERIKQYTAKTRLSPRAVNRYCMTCGDVDALYRVARENLINALLVAFDYGQAKGYRAAKAEARRA